MEKSLLWRLSPNKIPIMLKMGRKVSSMNSIFSEKWIIKISLILKVCMNPTTPSTLCLSSLRANNCLMFWEYKCCYLAPFFMEFSWNQRFTQGDPSRSWTSPQEENHSSRHETRKYSPSKRWFFWTSYCGFWSRNSMWSSNLYLQSLWDTWLCFSRNHHSEGTNTHWTRLWCFLYWNSFSFSSHKEASLLR